MSTSPQAGGQRVIYVPLDHEPEVTQEGFAIALGYLYSSVSLNLLRPDNARGVLAAGCLLGGMDDLCGYAYEACRQHIRLETVNEWLDFIQVAPGENLVDGELPPPTIFGHYAQRLREDVLHFLVVILPAILEIHRPGSSQNTSSTPVPNGRGTLLQIFSRVPFDLFKTAIESPSFEIGPDQTRFKFAKDAIELRKSGIARGTAETVVLAFVGDNNGNSKFAVIFLLVAAPIGGQQPEVALEFQTTSFGFETETFVSPPCPRRRVLIAARQVYQHLPDGKPAETVASFKWTTGNMLGTARMGERQVHMADLAQTVANDPNCRAFHSVWPQEDPMVCMWQKVGVDTYAVSQFPRYVVHDVQADPLRKLWVNTDCIMEYHPGLEIVAGEADGDPPRHIFGTVQYGFIHASFFLEAVLALVVNRWIDRQQA
ncbi:hypothetical protein EWM64_g4711 [Hericium alpestre]|uniref:BTB domain-containing protein n=1 Tax=Hericium alpestre TaxID=135208 RepID=A0A4Y9ZZA5_9AGAM|nr:hypothetical protein EWM64_g4711 [Hericium alpestre]